MDSPPEVAGNDDRVVMIQSPGPNLEYIVPLDLVQNHQRCLRLQTPVLHRVEDNVGKIPVIESYGTMPADYKSG